MEILAEALTTSAATPWWVTVLGQVLVFGGVLVSVMYGRNANVNAKAARTQVENDHKTNFREDADEKHDESKKQLDKLQRGQDRIATDVHAMKADLGVVKDDLSEVSRDAGLLKDGWEANRARIRSLEDTDARRRSKEEWGPPPTTRRERRARNA